MPFPGAVWSVDSEKGIGETASALVFEITASAIIF